MFVNDIKFLKYCWCSEIWWVVSEDCFLDDWELEDDCRFGFLMLKLSKMRIFVGDSVIVYWDIRE